MKATPIDELRKPHPDQKQIDADAVSLLLATAPAGYAKKRSARDRNSPLPADYAPLDLPTRPR
jgi:hypothetical protein